VNTIQNNTKKNNLKSHPQELKHNQELNKHNTELKGHNEEMQRQTEERSILNSELERRSVKVETQMKSLERWIHKLSSSSEHQWPMRDSNGLKDVDSAMEMIADQITELKRHNQELAGDNATLEARLCDVQLARAASLGSLVAARTVHRRGSLPLGASLFMNDNDSHTSRSSYF